MESQKGTIASYHLRVPLAWRTSCSRSKFNLMALRTPNNLNHNLGNDPVGPGTRPSPRDRLKALRPSLFGHSPFGVNRRSLESLSCPSSRACRSPSRRLYKSPRGFQQKLCQFSARLQASTACSSLFLPIRDKRHASSGHTETRKSLCSSVNLYEFFLDMLTRVWNRLLVKALLGSMESRRGQ
jgi:hypothetical protein